MPKKENLPSTVVERAAVPLTGEQKRKRGKLMRVLVELLLKYETSTTKNDPALPSRQMRATMYIKVSKAHSTLERNEYVYTLDILEFFGHQNPYGKVAKVLFEKGVCTLDDFFDLPIETIQEYCTSEGEPELPHLVCDLHEAYNNPPPVPQVEHIWRGLVT